MPSAASTGWSSAPAQSWRLSACPLARVVTSAAPRPISASPMASTRVASLTRSESCPCARHLELGTGAEDPPYVLLELRDRPIPPWSRKPARPMKRPTRALVSLVERGRRDRLRLASSPCRSSGSRPTPAARKRSRGPSSRPENSSSIRSKLLG